MMHAGQALRPRNDIEGQRECWLLVIEGEPKMTKVVVTVEVDQAEYDRAYGPGTEFWEKYHGKASYAWTSKTEQKAIEDYKKNHSENGVADAIVDALREAFYDWSDKGWLTLSVEGKTVCKVCGGVEGHKPWCVSIVASPEDDSLGNHIGPSEEW